MSATTIAWPARIEPEGDYYPVPDVGDCIRVTSVLDVVGTGKRFLINWAAGIEREATIEAACEVVARTGGQPGLRAAIEARLGPARQHVKALEKAGNIGSQIHQRIHWETKGLLGEPRDPFEPALTNESAIGYLSYQNWRRSSGLTPVRAEQTVWHPKLKYAGTVDEFAIDPAGDLWIVDYKSAKYVYDTHHLQCMAYVAASRALGIPVKGAVLIHLPKSAAQISANGIKPIPLGKMWDRELSAEEMWESFQAALTLWRGLVEREEVRIARGIDAVRAEPET